MLFFKSTQKYRTLLWNSETGLRGLIHELVNQE